MKQSTKRSYLACTAALRICFSPAQTSGEPSKSAKTNPGPGAQNRDGSTTRLRPPDHRSSPKLARNRGGRLLNAGNIYMSLGKFNRRESHAR